MEKKIKIDIFTHEEISDIVNRLGSAHCNGDEIVVIPRNGSEINQNEKHEISSYFKEVVNEYLELNRIKTEDLISWEAMTTFEGLQIRFDIKIRQ